MNIIIVGAGEVGSYLAHKLSEEDHDVTLIEQDECVIPQLDESLNVKVILDNGASAAVLKSANIQNADYFLAMTTNDAVNLVSSSIAKALGAKHTIARIHHHTYNENAIFNYQVHFGIDHLINPEALCAIELAKSIRNPGKVAVESFARGTIEIHQIEITKKSPLTYQPLAKLKLEPSLRIGYVTRGETIEIPTATTILEAGDYITLFGSPEGISAFKERLTPEPKPGNIKKVCLFGGSETAIVLGRMLVQRDRFHVKIIEKNPHVCDALAREFPKITIINGDGTSLRLLEEENIGNCDFFIGSTKDDEDNIMTCIQAKSLGVKHVQLVINKPDYETILNELQLTLGIEAAVSPRNATVRKLMRYLSLDKCRELAQLPGSQAIIIEMKVSRDCAHTEKTFKEIPWPPQTVAIALQHKFRSTVPGADDKILSGDRLVLITLHEHVGRLKSMFSE